MTRFAADVLGVLSFGHQPGMRRCTKVARDILVAGLATFRTNELRAGDLGRCENRSVCLKRAARKQNHGERRCSPNAP